MKILLPLSALCFLSVCHAAEFPSADHWLTKSALVAGPLTDESTEVPEERFYECKITRLGTAVRELKETDFVKLTEEQAAYYAGSGYRSKKGTQAFLVRGAFTHYTGKFVLNFHEGVLQVSHASLGRPIPASVCPLIVQLPEAPRKVVVRVGGAM